MSGARRPAKLVRPVSDMVVAFTVLGEPAPQGSKVRNRYGGIRESNPRTRPYRQAVAAEAQIAMEAGCVGLIFGRNMWQRSHDAALAMSARMHEIMKDYGA